MTASLTEPQIDVCPTWCKLTPGHGWELTQPDGRRSRGHAGPDFGPHIAGGSIEVEAGDQVAQIVIWCDGLDFTPIELLDLAADAIAAASWLENVH